MSGLKKLSPEAIPAALEKAHRYRLLNEPLQAESICLDILEADPENQRGLATLVLALTDQFASRMRPNLQRVRELLPRLGDEYQRLYYSGLIAERQAAALIEQGGGRRGYIAFELFREAMDWYEKAAACAPPGDDDPVLRWNTCVRMIERHPQVRRAPDDPRDHMLE